jgi:hypothetical protein
MSWTSDSDFFENAVRSHSAVPGRLSGGFPAGARVLFFDVSRRRIGLQIVNCVFSDGLRDEGFSWWAIGIPVNANPATTGFDYLDSGSDIDLHKRLAGEASEILRHSGGVDVQFCDRLVESNVRGTNRLIPNETPASKILLLFGKKKMIQECFTRWTSC